MSTFLLTFVRYIVEANTDISFSLCKAWFSIATLAQAQAKYADAVTR